MYIYIYFFKCTKYTNKLSEKKKPTPKKMSFVFLKKKMKKRI